MIIREMTYDDISGAVRLDREIFKINWETAAFKGELDKSYAYYYAAVEENELAGFAGVCCVYETADVMRIAVAEKYRKQGIGNKLMEALVKKARECGCIELCLK